MTQKAIWAGYRKSIVVEKTKKSARQLRTSFTLIGHDINILALSVLLATLSGAVQTLLMFFLATIAFAISNTEVPRVFFLPSMNHPPHIQTLLALACGLVVIICILAIPIARLQASVVSRATMRLRMEVISSYLNASSAYKASVPEGYFQQIIGEYCYNISISLQRFCAIFSAGATLVAVIASSLVVNPRVGVTVLVAVLLAGVLVGPIARLMRREKVDRAAISREIVAQSAQISRIFEEIESYDVKRNVSRNLEVEFQKSSDALQAVQTTDSIMPVMFQFGSLAIVLSILSLFIFLYPGRHPSVAALVLVIIRVLTYARQIMMSSQSSGRIVPFADALAREQRKMAAAVSKRGANGDTGFDGFDLVDVSFRHPDSAKILSCANLSVAQGEMIAIVGRSGAGKSTFCSLLMGLYTPTSGAITTCGVDLHDIAPSRWAELVAYVPQDPKLIRGTILQNIQFYRDGFTRHDVEQAAIAAHLHEDIVQFEDGYDTEIGPAARGLSGGQRQRLVIARALLGKPKLLLLDEPSSALDPRSEALIGETLSELKGGTTIVLVTHRTHSLEICDRVFRLQHGKFDLQGA